MKNDSFESPVLVAIGSNLASGKASPAETIRASLSALSFLDFKIEAVSRFFKTPAYPPGNGPDFVNAAVRAGYAGTPEAALAALHDVEAQFGRVRRRRWAARTLDLDLIAFGAQVLPDPATQTAWRQLPDARKISERPDTLILPHPRMHERAFVLVPLAEVAPDWRHPLLNRTVRELRDALAPAALAEVCALPATGLDGPDRRTGAR